MIASLTIDLDDAPDFPGATAEAFGRPIAAYPLIAARSSRHVGRHFVITASQPVRSVALQNEAVLVHAPEGASGLARLMLHGYRAVRDDLKAEGAALELLVVLLANAPAVTGELIDQGVEALLSRAELDSALSVSPQLHFKPSHARRETKDGLLEPYIPGAKAEDAEAWYPNWGVQILRPRLLDAPAAPEGALGWIGRKVFPLKQWGGGPVDYKWQIPALEFWLKKHGHLDRTPNRELQPKPQPQAAPKGDRR